MSFKCDDSKLCSPALAPYPCSQHLFHPVGLHSDTPLSTPTACTLPSTPYCLHLFPIPYHLHPTAPTRQIQMGITGTPVDSRRPGQPELGASNLRSVWNPGWHDLPTMPFRREKSEVDQLTSVCNVHVLAWGSACSVSNQLLGMLMLLAPGPCLSSREPHDTSAMRIRDGLSH